MKEQERKSSYRIRVQEEIQKLSAGEVFTTPAYLELLRSIAGELTGGRLSTICLYSSAGDGYLGRCDGRQIWINLENGVTKSFPEISQKNLSLVGILGHECGHKNYSDFALRKKYVEGILEGSWYPYPPSAETPQEEQDLEQILAYFERKEMDALSLICEVAAYLNNLLEDIYIEQKMCEQFPGSIRRGILLNRERNVEWLPSLRELIKEKEDPVSILMNLCAQYALSERINNWEEEEHELLTVVKTLLPLIRSACASEDSTARFLAANQIVLKIWKYLYGIIQEIEEQKAEKEEASEQEESEQEKSEEKESEQTENRSEEDGTQEKETEAKDDTKQETETQDVTKECGDVASMEEASSMQEYLKHLVSMLPQFIQDPLKEQEAAGSEKDAIGSSFRESEAKGELPQKAVTNINGMIDADGPMQLILQQMAKESVDVQMEQELQLQLQREMAEIPFDGGHEKVRKKICREKEITELQKAEYLAYAEQVKKIQRKLQSSLTPLLQNQGARSERRLLIGKRLDMASIANQQGRIYRKDYPGKRIDMAIAVLIDMSDSMRYARIEQSKLAALGLYEFCQKAGIAVLVYGHHTDGYQHSDLEDETVYLHSCAEFEPDRKDRYRIAVLQPHGANRDGLAIRFIGKKLMQRPEKQKMLVVISDGLPNSNYYSGKMAQEDLVRVKKELNKNGVIVLAAAIGADKERIQEIYQESYLDISDIEKLPVILAKQVIKYIRRY